MGSVARLLAETSREQQLLQNTESVMTEDELRKRSEPGGDSTAVVVASLRNPQAPLSTEDGVLVGAVALYEGMGGFLGSPCPGGGGGLKSITPLFRVELIVE